MKSLSAFVLLVGASFLFAVPVFLLGGAVIVLFAALDLAVVWGPIAIVSTAIKGVSAPRYRFAILGVFALTCLMVGVAVSPAMLRWHASLRGEAAPGSGGTKILINLIWGLPFSAAFVFARHASQINTPNRAG